MIAHGGGAQKFLDGGYYPLMEGVPPYPPFLDSLSIRSKKAKHTYFEGGIKRFLTTLRVHILFIKYRGGLNYWCHF